MAMNLRAQIDFDDESDEQDVSEHLDPHTVAAVVSGTDWTTETIVAQLKRDNIQLNPRFQRRDAWKRDRKSRFIESLIVGLPIPQIVLAESKEERGRFIVLDGKQRLLSLLQFWGHGIGPDNKFPLTGLPLREDLRRITFADLKSAAAFRNDYNALCNQAIRTVVLKNWRDTNFLHTVFLRLNTGSVTLSPQELRQALLPGRFSDYIDEAAGASLPLRELLGTEGPDPRMRDIEILARFLAFHFFADTYPGRMKEFLDSSFSRFNKNWVKYEEEVTAATRQFEFGINALIKVFGDEIARKPDSLQFNRAIFDALIYFHARPDIRKAVEGKPKGLRKAYSSLFSKDSGFLKAVESDTAGAPNTASRLKLWARALASVIGRDVKAPTIPQAAAKSSKRTKKST